MTREQQIMRQARGALMYPMFMMLMAVTVTVFLLTFVLPRFAKIYASKEAALPPPTRLLIALSNGLTSYWYLWLGGTVLAIISVIIFSKTESGRRCLDWIKLNAPICRMLFSRLYITRACRTMGTMISAGISMLEMVQIVKQVTNNSYYPGFPSWTLANEHRWPPARIIPSPPPQQRLLFIF
jgi:type IV pilus assembly protein PilC